MLILLSPAKKLSITGEKLKKFTLPTQLDKSEQLINELKKYSPKKLQKLMGVSPAIAELNVERYHLWKKEHNQTDSKQAILTFTGEVYSGLDASSLSEKEIDYAQDHLRILSGLYGVLKPLDLMHEYRLEMGTKLKIKKHTNLYGFWGDVIAKELNDILATHKNKTIVNLASTEYFKSVNTKKLKTKIITPIFKDGKNGNYKVVMVYAKKARGMMANYIIKNKINNAEDLIGFNIEGYYFNPKLSTETELVFYRD
ncbi:MAG: peroxide stress protein YaaA [Flavobacteriales bacterium]